MGAIEPVLSGCVKVYGTDTIIIGTIQKEIEIIKENPAARGRVWGVRHGKERRVE